MFTKEKKIVSKNLPMISKSYKLSLKSSRSSKYIYILKMANNNFIMWYWVLKLLKPNNPNHKMIFFSWRGNYELTSGCILVLNKILLKKMWKMIGKRSNLIVLNF